MSAAGWYALALLLMVAAGLASTLLQSPKAARAALLTMAVAEGCIAGCGFTAVLAHEWSLDMGSLLGFPTVLGADSLSGLFLALTGMVAACTCLVVAFPVRTSAEVPPRAVGATALMLLAVAVTITARDAFTLLLAWEVLSFTFYVLSGYRGTSVTTRVGLVTYAFAKSSGAALLIGLLLLAARSGHLDLAGLPDGATGGVHDAAYALLFVAFATKVGIVPLHVWMPAAYESAPAGVRPLMAGVAVNAGFYGLWRTVDLLGAPPLWLVVTTLLLAAATALLGIAHATVQTHLPRVVAWSSVENAGLITVGLGVALVGAYAGDSRLLAVGLLAGVMQTVAHAFAKALLFTTTSTFETTGQTSDINGLKGSAWRSPFSGVGFVVACTTLAALPPTVGFASEWFLLESLMQQFRVAGLLLHLTLAFTGALVALTTGFAGVAFVRLVGFVALGDRVTRGVRREQEDIGIVARCGLAGLIFGCLGIAVLSPWEIVVIGRGMAPLVSPSVTHGALTGTWVLQPVFPGFSALSPSWLWITMPLLLGAVWLISVLLSRGGLRRVRRVAPWRSASRDVRGDTNYTAFGFANPTRKVLANVLLTRAGLVEVERSSGGRVGDEERGPAGAHLGYTSDVVEVVERFLYRPLRKPTIAVVHAMKRLQSGRLDAYVTYMLLAVVAVLALVVGLS